MERQYRRYLRRLHLLLGLLLGLFCALGLSGCSTLGYLLQAGRGQLELINRARPIPEVLKDERTPPRIKALLREIPEIKKFGERYGIKPTSNYTDYVRLDRPASVWVVSACEPLEFKSRVWSFPIVGSFTYVGWFSREGAMDYAHGLKKEGLDVDVRGARAYSTIGWFKDAVLSTMIPDDESALGDLVNVVLHESVHATLYLNGQSTFNESIASYIADQLTPLYLEAARGKSSPEYVAYAKSEREGREREVLLNQAYASLDALYKSSEAHDAKLRKKEALLGELTQKIQARRPINNAMLIQFKTYRVGFAEFEGLLSRCKRNWRQFWSALFKADPKQFSSEQATEFTQVVEGLKQYCQP